MSADDPKPGSNPPTSTPRDALAKARHDLRTPINQILGYAELLQEEAQEQQLAGFVDDLDKIANAARTMLGLVEAHFSAPLDPAPRESTDATGTLAASPRPVTGPVRVVDSSELGDLAEWTSGAHALPAVEAARASDPDALPGDETILVVDDQELNREMLARRLRSRGYRVEVAEDGAAALRMVSACEYSLILLDVMMPGISGMDVLRTLRERYSAGALPIIMATAVSSGRDIVEALRQGANDYVTKPLDFDVVMARVETQLSLKRATERIQRLAEGLELRNRVIRDIFGRYMSDEVVASLLASPKHLELGGEKRKVTIMMTDLRGFTPMVEQLAPEQVVRLLNKYLGAMADVISRYQGTINEFIGDAILVLFGAPIQRPDDARRAVACALAMQRAMESVNDELAAELLPRIEMGASLTTGEVVVGNIGSNKRVKYGVVGSQVNLAARMESHTVGGQVLISESSLAEAGPDVEVGAKIILRAKGFSEPIAVHELRGIGGEHAIALPDRTAAAVALRHPIVVRYSEVQEKTVSDAAVYGSFARLWAGGAELRCAQYAPPLLSNLKITVVGKDGREIPGDLYVKVVSVQSDVPVCAVRFTSVPSEVATFIRHTLTESRVSSQTMRAVRAIR